MRDMGKQKALIRDIWNNFIIRPHNETKDYQLSVSKLKSIVEKYLSEEVEPRRALPFKIGETYETKFQTKEQFIIKDIKYRPHSKVTPLYFNGIYVGREHLGLCLLNADRLIPRTI